ncbi:hypothetical protein RhiirB3_458490 [Rhizophagus irregularis]|uniref:Uncharacterized protein n=1 Tax=Rhizophagus irregularis (strain DAOM 181602 / DAOM 197198 / MUCL 43194) TaxID=747089 RepID=U9SP76_RHIID|nr:hypothetical protein RhiirB3_458490 [Rhizophagus irregularis]
MPKHKEYTVTLISSGLIVGALHYGLFVIIVNLKDWNFFIEVVETFSNYGQIPGYICKCDGIQSELCKSLTAAVNSIYKEIF